VTIRDDAQTLREFTVTDLKRKGHGAGQAQTTRAVL
jgi:hypothetical protein